MLLALLCEIDAHPELYGPGGSAELPAQWAIVSGAMDGREGSSLATGAVLDSTSLARAKALDLNLARALQEHNSASVFEALADQLVTGWTVSQRCTLYESL